MMVSPLTIVFLTSCFFVIVSSASTDVSQCEGKNYEGLKNNVTVVNCRKPPCKLRRGTKQSVQIIFTPDHQIKDITTRVTANVIGLDLPFVGVDGYSACDKLFRLTPEGEQPAKCPLKPNETYMYKNTFDVLQIYPRLNRLTVHWALTDKGKDVICFEVSAKIL